ncbi:nucleotide exchange factor GrpE [Aliiroseovarius sp. S2029]|uniref:nucleotide exchange factor GrpE n=1 Tax=Aliiroseovarius sp. S2029 TaxID=2936988 RepID=UPI0020C0B6DA|nr:nucleotide exchange factor GrpE [Aliiroseovarius sp. S2029]MCK8484263.1 nucleotide exchange factor GrpE [Aliiroseovarius sp. S2029]
MSETEKKTQAVAVTDGVASDATDSGVMPKADEESAEAEIAHLTDKWKRALADAENTRKRADMSRAEGREHGIAVAVEALAPALDDLSLGIEAARTSPDAEDPRIISHLEGLRNIRTAFATGLKALGVRTIAPEHTSFDPALHEAMQTEETDQAKPGQVLVLHRPGFAIGQRLIRPARVTVSAAPVKAAED